MKKYMTIKNRCIEVCLWGKGPAAVLFFHGFGSSAAALPANERWLTQNGLQLICMNRPGVGGSGLLSDYSIDTVTADAKSVLEQLNISQCTVAGWSAGGLFAQAFAQAFPENTLSLHLISSALPFAHKAAQKLLPARWKTLCFINRYFPLAAKAVFKSRAKKAKRYPDGMLQQSIDEMVPADKILAADSRFYPLLMQAAMEGFANEGKAVFAEAKAIVKANMDYTKIHCPVHIWTGGQDAIWPPATAVFLHRQLPQSSLHINRSGGHLLYLKEWERLLRAMSLQTA